MSFSHPRSIFSRLGSGSSSIRSQSQSSTSSTAPSIPKGCREYTRSKGSRYAKDGKGFNFNITYPYSTSDAVASEKLEDTPVVPVGCRDFKLRYAKDGKGHDFTTSYVFASGYSSAASSSATLDVMPRGCRDFNKTSSPRTMLYAKDGKGFDFSETYVHARK